MENTIWTAAAMKFTWLCHLVGLDPISGMAILTALTTAISAAKPAWKAVRLACRAAAAGWAWATKPGELSDVGRGVLALLENNGGRFVIDKGKDDAEDEDERLYVAGGLIITFTHYDAAGSLETVKVADRDVLPHLTKRDRKAIEKAARTKALFLQAKARDYERKEALAALSLAGEVGSAPSFTLAGVDPVDALNGWRTAPLPGKN